MLPSSVSPENGTRNSNQPIISKFDQSESYKRLNSDAPSSPAPRRDPLALSPMSSNARSRHVARARGVHRHQTLNASQRMASLDETLVNLRRLVPSTNQNATTVDSYEALEVLLSDTVRHLSNIATDPQLLVATRKSVTYQSVLPGPIIEADTTIHSANPPQSIPQQVENLVALLKLKKRRRQTPSQQQLIDLLRN